MHAPENGLQRVHPTHLLQVVLDRKYPFGQLLHVVADEVQVKHGKLQREHAPLDKKVVGIH